MGTYTPRRLWPQRGNTGSAAPRKTALKHLGHVWGIKQLLAWFMDSQQLRRRVDHVDAPTHT